VCVCVRGRESVYVCAREGVSVCEGGIAREGVSVCVCVREG